MIFVSFFAILVVLIVLLHMTIKDILVCFLAFLPTGWGILLVSLSLACVCFIIYTTMTVACLLLFHLCFRWFLTVALLSLPDCASLQASFPGHGAMGICPSPCAGVRGYHGDASVHTNYCPVMVPLRLRVPDADAV